MKYLAYHFQKNGDFTTQGTNYNYLITDPASTYSGSRLFARNVHTKNLNMVSLNLGVSVQQSFANVYRLGAHLFYERRLTGHKLKSRSDFLDFPGRYWVQEQKIGKNLLRVGVDFKYQPEAVGFFGLVGIDYAKAFSGNGYRDFGGDLKFGYKF